MLALSHSELPGFRVGLVRLVERLLVHVAVLKVESKVGALSLALSRTYRHICGHMLSRSA